MLTRKLAAISNQIEYCMRYHDTSFWVSDLTPDNNPPHRAELHSDLEVDVAIIGAGYTGLWSAYYLKQAKPELSIAIFEAQEVGFGASGRNGGWLMGSIEGQDELLEHLPLEQRRRALQQIYGLIDETQRVCLKEGIDCDLHRGGWLNIAARYPEQLPRLQQSLKHLRHLGHRTEDYQWLDAAQVQKRLNIQNPYGGIFTPHTARIQPAKLAAGLAKTVERLGVTIYSKTAVESFKSGQLSTAKVTVNADIILPCTEGFSREQPSQKRFVLPIQSLIIATEPLSDDLWQEIGLNNNETFGDASRLSTYGQRTADNRLVFGARGTYQFGGHPKARFEDAAATFDATDRLLREALPMLASADIPHRWGGTLGITRTGAPHALFDKATGIGYAGGYGGEGVGASNLMARTLVDLILQKDTELAGMPWAYRGTLKQHIKRWEPEPLRWLGYSGILKMLEYEEEVLNNPQSPPWKRRTVNRLASAAIGLM